jgi:thiol-disulfide isomerase/thioredoxin
VFLALTLAGPGYAQDESPEIGRPAPPIRIGGVVQDPARQPVRDVTSKQLFDALEGKVVVIEFWGTWCGPCVAAMKSLETVERAAAAAQDGDDFAFLYITDETPEHVREWLAADERRRPGGWVVCDLVPPDGTDDQASRAWPGGLTFKGWGVSGRPSTWVLRPEGDGHVIAGKVRPSLLTLDDLRRVRDKQPAAQPNVDAGGGGVFVPGENAPVREVPLLEVEFGVDPLLRYEPPAGRESVPEPDVFVTLRESAYDQPMTNAYTSWINTRIGVEAVRIIEDHYRQRGFPMQWAPGAENALPSGLYDYIVRVPRERWKSYEPLVDAAITATFGVRGRVEEREVDVYLLQAGSQTASRLQSSILGPDDGGGTSDWRVTDGVRRLAFVNGDLSWLADTLTVDTGGVLDRPVIDATGIPGRETRGIDLAIEFRDGDAQDLRRVLERDLDLRLVPGKRKVKYLVIEAVEPDIVPATQPAEGQAEAPSN